ncbi:hypothetical protein BC943DRAFT_323049 [Umbelopsis sp. AD052]|nr:hypothetical protein BC943DRAFT_323049 [Umbelopsis sp. AD052]
MLLGWYLKYGISLAASGLLLVVATESTNNPPATPKRYDLDAKSGTFIGPFESSNPHIQQRSNTPFSGHDYIISTHQLSYNVKAAGRLLYGVSSSLAQTPTVSISVAPPTQTTATVQAGQGSTIALAPPTVTTALTNTSGTNVITSFTSEIEVRLKCNLDATFCSKVANAFGSAISQLGQVLRVKNRIVVDASYYNFCDKQCANGTYGWALPSSQYTLPNLNGVDPNYLHPQALAKQLSPYNSTSWSTSDGQDFDISAEFNHDAYLAGTTTTSAQGWNGTGVIPGGRFWFQEDTTIRSDQIDMEYIILHELLHGLGFLSSWGSYFVGPESPYFMSLQNMVDPSYLSIATLTPNSYTDSKTGAVYLTGFLPGMIFDKYAIANMTHAGYSQSLATIGDDIQNFCLQNDGAYIVNFIKQFHNSNHSSNAEYVYNLLQANQSMAFNLSSQSFSNLSSDNQQPLKASNIILYTTSNASNSEFSPNNFRPGLMMSHLDDSYLGTPNFLMSHSYESGITLQDLTAQVYQNSPPIYVNTTLNGTTVQTLYNFTVGPGILDILNTIGYGSITNNVTYPAVFSSDKQYEPKKRSGCSSGGMSGSQTSFGISVRSIPLPFVLAVALATSIPLL